MKELVEFLFDKKISDDAFELISTYPLFPDVIGKWHRVVEDNLGVDLPSIKYYEDEIKECPYNCKEFNGEKYVHFTTDIGAEAYGISKFY